MATPVGPNFTQEGSLLVLKRAFVINGKGYDLCILPRNSEGEPISPQTAIDAARVSDLAKRIFEAAIQQPVSSGGGAHDAGRPPLPEEVSLELNQTSQKALYKGHSITAARPNIEGISLLEGPNPFDRLLKTLWVEVGADVHIRVDFPVRS